MAKGNPKRRTARATLATDSLENLLTGQGGRADSRADGARRFIYRRRPLEELQSTFRANWLAGAVVEIPAYEMTREGREFKAEDSAGIDQIETAQETLDYWQRVRECIQWADCFGGGGILLGIDGHGPLEEPLDRKAIKQDQLQFLHALDARTLFPFGSENVQLNFDPTSPNFGRPEWYTVAGATQPRIHHTRIIRFQGYSLPWIEMQRTLWWGGSRLERVLDAIQDAEQVVGGVAQLVTEAKVDVYKIVDLMSLLSTPGGTEQVQKRIAISDRLKSMYQAIILDAKEDYEAKENAMAQGMALLVEQYLAIVAAAAGMPVTRLLGTSARGLNATGEGDLRNFYDMIAARQKTYLRPRLCELDEIVIRSATGKEPEAFPWKFLPLWQLEPTQEAEIESKRATTAETYVRIGAMDESHVARELLTRGTYTGVDEQWVKELERMAAEPPPPPVLPVRPANPEDERPEPGRPVLRAA